MTFFARLRYACFLTVAGGMLIGFVASIAELDATELLLRPVVAIGLFAVAWILAPLAERALPFKRTDD